MIPERCLVLAFRKSILLNELLINLCVRCKRMGVC
jgi:hypothetical protein